MTCSDVHVAGLNVPRILECTCEKVVLLMPETPGRPAFRGDWSAGWYAQTPVPHNCDRFLDGVETEERPSRLTALLDKPAGAGGVNA